MLKKILQFLLLLSVSTLSFAQSTEMEQDMFENMREGDKAVVVAVHSGTKNDAGLLCIERFNERLRKAYPNYDFREAWTTKGADQRIPTPDVLFNQLQKDGYTHVLVQSSDIINSADMQFLRYAVDVAKMQFKHIRLGEPLLSDASDYEEVLKATATACGQTKQVNVLVCNGTMGIADSQYTMLDYVLRDKDMKGWYVGTINGTPSLESLIRQLKRQKNKKVHLIPFMFAEETKTFKEVCDEWAQRLQSVGYKVTTEMNGLGQMDAIIDIFENHIRHAEKFRALTAKEQRMVIR